MLKMLLRDFLNDRLLHLCSYQLTTLTHALLLLSIRIVKAGVVLTFVVVEFGHDLILEVNSACMIDVTSLLLQVLFTFVPFLVSYLFVKEFTTFFVVISVDSQDLEKLFHIRSI